VSAAEQSLADVNVRTAFDKAQASVQAFSTGTINASMLSKELASAFETISSQDADGVLGDLPVHRDIAYQLYYANEIAMSVVDTHVTNVVGTGLTLSANMNRRVLESRAGLSSGQIDDLEEQIEDDFQIWAESPQYCDADREMTFYDFQDLALRTRMIGGDAPILIARRDARRVMRNGYLTQLQSISPRRLRNRNDKADTAQMRGGIERDRQGRIRYHFSRRDPNTAIFSGAEQNDWFPPIPQFSGNGRQNVILLKKMLESQQTRGRPILMVIAKLIGRVGKFTDMQVMAAIKSAYFSVYMKESPDEFAHGEEKLRQDLKLEGDGAIVSGEAEPELLTSNHPGPHVEQFYTAAFKLAGMATGIPYEILVKSFTTSYSASRAAINEYKKLKRAEQKQLRLKMCRPVYCSHMYDRVQQGVFNLPGFMEDEQLRNAYCGAFWIPPAEGALDKNREIMPEIALIQNNLKSEGMVTEEILGVPFKVMVAKIARDRRLLEREGIDPAPLTPNLAQVTERLAALVDDDPDGDDETDDDNDDDSEGSQND